MSSRASTGSQLGTAATQKVPTTSDDDGISNWSRFAEQTDVSFPGESPEYRAARDRLLQREAEPRHATECCGSSKARTATRRPGSRGLQPGGGPGVNAHVCQLSTLKWPRFRPAWMAEFSTGLDIALATVPAERPRRARQNRRSLSLSRQRESDDRKGDAAITRATVDGAIALPRLR
jgi:hypothetical protein